MTISSLYRQFLPALLVLTGVPAWAQDVPSQAPAQNPVCTRLEAQLASVDRGAGDPARADQIKRYEESLNKQQSELERVGTQARRAGCEGSGFFQLFSGQSQQCGPLNNQIQQLRSTIDRTRSDLERLQAASVDQNQRRGILVALAQNDCGSQYRAAAQAAQPRNFFETLFGGGGGNNGGFAPSEPTQNSAYRTVCVRTCDGFYFPISFSTGQSRFGEDEQACKRMCPAAEAMLFSYRNPGEDIAKATSLSGRLYTELPNAFRYRQKFDSACSCRKPGESWAQALQQADDRTVERGDIVVTEERSKQMAQPKAEPPPRAGRADARSGQANARPTAATPSAAPAASEPPPAAAAAASVEKPAETDPAKRTVRNVGPQFLPASR
jgi:flagellar biosynthesis chaperone FliJ